MKALDHLLRRWRIAKARPWILRGSRVLDVGCFDAAIFRQLEDRVSGGVGIDLTALHQVIPMRLVITNENNNGSSLQSLDARTEFLITNTGKGKFQRR